MKFTSVLSISPFLFLTLRTSWLLLILQVFKVIFRSTLTFFKLYISAALSLTCIPGIGIGCVIVKFEGGSCVNFEKKE